MNWVDLIIIALVVVGTIRGFRSGFLWQIGSLIGFFSGWLIGAYVAALFAPAVNQLLLRSIAVGVFMFTTAFLLMAVGELLGEQLERLLRFFRMDILNRLAGAVLGAVTPLLACWLLVAILVGATGKNPLQQSWIVNKENKALPAAPQIIARIGRVLGNNAFPQVFLTMEPTPSSTFDVPDSNQIQGVAKSVWSSVVKVSSKGCGGMVDGSGFVVATNIVLTNAHVIAGVSHPQVQDGLGWHDATPVFFDPNIDVAVLRVSGLQGPALTMDETDQAPGTKAVVLGYPGGGSYTGTAAVVSERIIAVGRNIYGEGEVERGVYQLWATVRPGNSGGPVVRPDGEVIGMVFAASDTDPSVGYALTARQIAAEITQGKAATKQVSTDRCPLE